MNRPSHPILLPQCISLAAGVLPSSATATFPPPKTLARAQTAAPEDGRTPPNTYPQVGEKVPESQ